MTIYNGELIVGGEFSKAGGQDASNIAAWNGTSWRTLSAGLNNKVYGLTVFRDELIATGVGGGVMVQIIHTTRQKNEADYGDAQDEQTQTTIHAWALTGIEAALEEEGGK
jgi:hypothetical protein